MEKKKKFRSKILTLAFCGLAALSMSAATTFAWFTQNITPKVSQFGINVITANDDLNISFAYSFYTSGDTIPDGSNVGDPKDWSPWGPTVAAKYFGVDGTGTVLAADGTVGFFESADGVKKNIRLKEYSTSLYVDGSSGDITTPGFDSTAGLLKLYDRDSDPSDFTCDTPNGTASTGSYLKLTFKFQSATQYNVTLNTKSDGTELKNTYVKPSGKANGPARNRAWAAVGSDVVSTQNLEKTSGSKPYNSETYDEGETLKTRGAFAVRVGFVGDSVLSTTGTEGSALYFDANAGVYVSEKNADCADTVYKATSNVIKIWDPQEIPVAATEDQTENSETHALEGGILGFPDNEEGVNMAYQYERYNAAVMEEELPGFVAPAHSDIHNTPAAATAAGDTWGDVVLLTLSPTADVNVYEGTLDVYIWLEGYDGDCFNDIYNDLMTIALQFKGIVPSGS